MITYTTNLNNDAYASLFEEIAAKGGPKIENLEQFFGNIQEIAQIDKKFLRLPLDEPMLEINANTRKINIDATDFKANGISVQGDHLAETVFFKIDRYFDFMDLMNTDIYINWKIGSESGRDKCFIKSDSIIPGCIVFGWSISNHITGKSGSLSFAVELEVMHDDGQKYSLNTLPATAAIKDGLVLIDPEVYDMSDNISAILSNSHFGEGSAAVENVVWVSGGGNGLVDDLAKEFSPIVNLVAKLDNAGVPYSEPTILYALAAAGRDASILYSDKNKQPQTALFVEAPKGALRDEVIYYIKEEGADAVPAYNPASSADLAAWGTEDEVPLYVSVIEVNANQIGEYYVHAQGVKYDEQLNDDGEVVEVKIGASAVVESSKVTIPAPEQPAAVNLAVGEMPAIEGYTFDENAEGVVYLTGDEGIAINASAEFAKDDFGLLAFEWFKDGIALTETKAYDVVNNSEYIAAAAGEYSAKVSHYRNGEIVEKESEKKLVSALASAIELGDVANLTIKQGRLGSINIAYELDNAAHANNVPTINCEMDLLVQDEDGQLIETKPITIDSVIVGESAIQCKVYAKDIIDDGGVYRIKVAHSYNGSIYTKETNNFNINIS